MCEPGCVNEKWLAARVEGRRHSVNAMPLVSAVNDSLPWWLPLLAVALGPLLGVLLLRFADDNVPFRTDSSPCKQEPHHEADVSCCPTPPMFPSSVGSSSASMQGRVSMRERRAFSRRSLETPDGIRSVLESCRPETLDEHVRGLPECMRAWPSDMRVHTNLTRTPCSQALLTQLHFDELSLLEELERSS